MTTKTLLTLLVAIAGLLLAACGGGQSVESAALTTEIAPQEGKWTWKHTNHFGIGFEGRRDYKRAMYDDCIETSGPGNCSVSGRGWFARWGQVPMVVVPRTSTREEVWAIQRTIAVLNRSLPTDKRLRLGYTHRTFVGIDQGDAPNHLQRLVPAGTIHAEIHPYDDPDFSGLAWTDGKRAFAFGDEIDFDFSNLNDDEFGWTMTAAIETMAHEFLHALGLIAHPHPIHTSIMSYRHYREGELDNVPLVDMAVLYDMYGWGHWSEDMRLVVDAVHGVQFGVHRLNYGAALIPWVDAGYMAAPPPDVLLGRASYKGLLLGYTASGFTAQGDAELSVNFDSNSGSAKFDQIQTTDGNTWNMWNRLGYRYDLNLYAHYFDSRTDARDNDGIPDVVGTFYGWDAEVAAGTLQRPEITAAFGAERD
ncbi:MAG: hypothetical protein OXT64_12460 [Gammaproteobacteria bacterium]|nr:hypothetical protein [Gammaproteobacteria bacterium]